MGTTEHLHKLITHHTSSPNQTDLLRTSGDEHPKGLAEEGGQEWVEGRRTLQEAVHLVQQGRVRGQLLVNLCKEGSVRQEKGKCDKPVEHRRLSPHWQCWAA